MTVKGRLIYVRACLASLQQKTKDGKDIIKRKQARTWQESNIPGQWVGQGWGGRGAGVGRGVGRAWGGGGAGRARKGEGGANIKD